LPTDDILIRFKADTGQLKAEFDELSANLRKVAAEEKKANTQSAVTSKEIAEAGKRRNVLLKAEIDVLKQLEQQKKKAFTVGDITEFNNRISQSQKNISLLKGETDKLSSSNSGLGASFSKLGGLIAAAFSVTQIIAFGNRAVDAFASAQKAVTQLTLVFNGNEGAQRRLLRLADELQDAFAIDNDVIISQINFLGLQGRTESQIQKVIKTAIQLQAVLGGSLEENVQKLDQTFEGTIGRLGKFDKDIATLTKTQLANGEAVDILAEKYAGFAEKGLEGVSGELQRIQVETENTVEKLGEQVAPIKLAAAKFASTWIAGVQLIIDETKKLLNPDTTPLNPANWFKPGFWESQGATTTPSTIAGTFLDQQIKSLSQFEDRQLEIIKANNEKRLAEREKLSKTEITIAETQIEAINKILADRNPAVVLDPEEQKKLEEALAKQRAAIQKDVEERRKSQESLAKFTFDEQNKNADLLAAQRKLTAQETIESEKLLALEELKIDADTLSQKRQNAIDTFQDTNAIDIAITNNLRQQTALRQEILKGGGELHPNREDYDKWVKETEEANQKVKDIFQQTLFAVLDANVQIANEINNVLKASSDQQIEQINERKDANIEAIDEQLEALEEGHQKERTSDESFERRKSELLQQRIAAEKKYDEQVKKIQLEQARRNKQIAIFEATLNLAKAISVALSAAPPPFNAVLAAISAVLAGVQLAAVIATPVPAFKKGTKGKHGSGLARVGEEGEEIVFLPSGAKVLPAQKTRQYSDVLDSMFDGKLDAYIHKNYVLPALKLQSPSVNINIDYKKLARANQQAKTIDIGNLHELAELFDYNPRRVI